MSSVEVTLSFVSGDGRWASLEYQNNQGYDKKYTLLRALPLVANEALFLGSVLVFVLLPL